jgi:hypothetical protein
MNKNLPKISRKLSRKARKVRQEKHTRFLFKNTSQSFGLSLRSLRALRETPLDFVFLVPACPGQGSGPHS